MSLPPVQKSALNLGHVSAPRAKVCPGSGARFYPLCISLPWIWGTFLPPVHKSVPDLGQSFTPRGMEKMKLGLPFWGALYSLFFF